MRIYIGFDDTDTAMSDRGTGKLSRWFEKKLPSETRQWGVVRQQLPALEGIPYTSKNSSACVVVETEGLSVMNTLISLAAEHIREHFLQGSDPGLCVAAVNGQPMNGLITFGKECCFRIVTQKEAMQAASDVHISGHGGTNDGIIGAAAAVGLTMYGWSGRFIEFGGLREFPGRVTVGDLEAKGIQVVSVDRNAMVPFAGDLVETNGWLRPKLWGGRPILAVQAVQGMPFQWEVLGKKSKKTHKQ
ncbi:MAG: hypothetical protein JXL81_02445, partial [Deltaproteobacteria bacterium]|nr:hypothetical protein [Deltaproteobacteria bacterium]